MPVSVLANPTSLRPPLNSLGWTRWHPRGNRDQMLKPWHPAVAALKTADERTALGPWLNMATRMDLDLRPLSPASRDLVAELVAVVLTHESAIGERGNRRGRRGVEKITEAVAAVAGSVLRAWAKEPARACFRSMSNDAFVGSPIGRAQFKTTKTALVDRGFLVDLPGINPGTLVDWGDGEASWLRRHAKAARFWPGDALLVLATRHGITPATAKSAFGQAVVTKVPKVVKPVRMKPLKDRPHDLRGGATARSEAGAGGPATPPMIRMTEAEERRLVAEVEEMNAFAAGFDVTGCAPPRWYRSFGPSRLLGGRWITAGAEGIYQRMEGKARTSDIRINGSEVVEVDVSSAHLTIMHGLLGLTLPRGDLYGFDDIPRDLAKVWVLVSLGSGSPARRWSGKSRREHGETIGRHNASEVAEAVIRRFPFMEAPAVAVETRAGLSKLAVLGPPAKLLTHRLMNIEAESIGEAMRALRADGILALPVHDSLIVPIAAKAAALAALRRGFEKHAGITPRVKESA